MRNGLRFGWCTRGTAVFLMTVVAFSAILVAATAARAADAEGAAPAEAAGGEPSEMEDLEEVNRRLENPLTSLWSLTFENTYTIKRGDLVSGTEYVNTFFFQPGLPVPIGEDLILISRPIFPIVTAPVLDPTERDGVREHETGFGDMQLFTLVGPSKASGFVWGVGPTMKFPTASDDALGSEKWQAGPAAMLFYMGKPWVGGVLVQHWWSYAGDDGRADVNQTDLQYIIRRQFPGAWSLGMGPTITMDWEADSDDRFTVPVGLGVSKTVRWGKRPVKLRAEVHYSVIRPDSFGTEWSFRFRIAPIIKSPFGK